MRAPSGAYVEFGPREFALYASVPKSDGLVVVLEVDTDCPGQVYVFCMRGGITESRMTVEEARYAGTAQVELLAVAQSLWPRKMKEEAA